MPPLHGHPVERAPDHVHHRAGIGTGFIDFDADLRFPWPFQRAQAFVPAAPFDRAERQPSHAQPARNRRMDAFRQRCAIPRAQPVVERRFVQKVAHQFRHQRRTRISEIGDRRPLCRVQLRVRQIPADIGADNILSDHLALERAGVDVDRHAAMRIGNEKIRIMFGQVRQIFVDRARFGNDGHFERPHFAYQRRNEIRHEIQRQRMQRRHRDGIAGPARHFLRHGTRFIGLADDFPRRGIKFPPGGGQADGMLRTVEQFGARP